MLVNYLLTVFAVRVSVGWLVGQYLGRIIVPTFGMLAGSQSEWQEK